MEEKTTNKSPDPAATVPSPGDQILWSEPGLPRLGPGNSITGSICVAQAGSPGKSDARTPARNHSFDASNEVLPPCTHDLRGMLVLLGRGVRTGVRF